MGEAVVRAADRDAGVTEPGQRFVVNTADAYVGPGGPGMHRYRLFVQAVGVSESSVGWELVEVWSESGRPPAPARDAATVGGFRRSEWASMLERGVVEVVAVCPVCGAGCKNTKVVKVEHGPSGQHSFLLPGGG